MKKLWLPVIVVVLVGYYHFRDIPPAQTLAAKPAADLIQADNSSLKHAIDSRASGVEVQGAGMVARILPDDTEGDRHQRFIVRLTSGETILIAQNIDISPRVDALNVGDRVSFQGEYVSNDKGGVVHWTHHDPRGRHQDGWIDHNGQQVQ